MLCFSTTVYFFLKRLRIPTDVAGATFMAAGSSMPTLFIAIASVFMDEGDIGLGTIMGSTMFNILFITACCGLCSGLVITLHSWPLVRDSAVYIVHLIALMAALQDNVVHWYESIVFPFLYSGYIVIMCFNTRLEKLFARVGEIFFNINKGFEMIEVENPKISSNMETAGVDASLETGKAIAEEQESTTKKENSDESTSKQLPDLAGAARFGTEKDIEEGSMRNDETSKNQDATGHVMKDNNTAEKQTSQIHAFEARSPFKIPQSPLKKLFWAAMLPTNALFYITLPDCRRKDWEAWYPVTFVISILWMALLSYILVWTVSIVGETYGIPECIMGLTLLAVGSSIPDAIASVVVAKHGMGDMAIANCVGSNIFDILCLGLPWLLATIAVHPGSVVLIHSGHILYTSLSLFGTVFVTLLVVHLNHWRLDKRLGWVLVVVYFLFLTMAIVLEATPGGPLTSDEPGAPKLSPHHPIHSPHAGLGHTHSNLKKMRNKMVT